MGACCSRCLRSNSSESETEMTQQERDANNGKMDSSNPSSISISTRMSAPSIMTSERDLKVQGRGLALVGVSIEQDAAYWEWHIETLIDDKDEDEDDFDAFTSLKFGVATKKNAKFYKAVESNEDGNNAEVEDGTALMKTISGLQDGDTIGVAVQQSDLPMVQFFLNGEPLNDLAINRFRGTVFPSVFLQDGFAVKGVFEEEIFREISPHLRFGPLIVARGII